MKVVVSDRRERSTTRGSWRWPHDEGDEKPSVSAVGPVGFELRAENGSIDDANGMVSRQIRVKSSKQTFSGTYFVCQKTCV
jgi:hypothetical protein